MRLPVLLLLTMASCSSAIVMAHDTPDQATAIKRIERLGGRVEPDRTSASQTEIAVSLCGCKDFDDDNMHLLKSIENLTSLDLSHTRITDEGLKELKGFKDLTVLMLADTMVTDAGLQELSDLKSLTILELTRTSTTDVGLKQLSGLTALKCLILNETSITDAGLKEFGGLPKLELLELQSTQITDAGLKELAGLQKLELLESAESAESGEWFESVEWFELQVAPTTDAGRERWVEQSKFALPEIDVPMIVIDSEQNELTEQQVLKLAGFESSLTTDEELSGIKNVVLLHLTKAQITHGEPMNLTGFPQQSMRTSVLGTKATDEGTNHVQQAISDMEVPSTPTARSIIVIR
jgi:internalin A